MPNYSFAKADKIYKASQIFPYLLQYRSLSPEKRDGINLVYKIKTSQNISNLPLINGNQKYYLELGADGTVKNLPNDNILKNYTVTKPENIKLSVAMDILPVINLDENISIAEINNSLNDYKAAINEVAGPMALIAPKLDSVKFKNINSAYGITKAGQRINLPINKNEITINPKNKTYKDVTNIVFDIAPSETLF